jgi:hypothetical protein
LSGFLLGALIALTLMATFTLMPSDGLYRVLNERSVVGAWVCENLTPTFHQKMTELPVFDREEN